MSDRCKKSLFKIELKRCNFNFFSLFFLLLFLHLLLLILQLHHCFRVSECGDRDPHEFYAPNLPFRVTKILTMRTQSCVSCLWVYRHMDRHFIHVWRVISAFISNIWPPPLCTCYDCFHWSSQMTKSEILLVLPLAKSYLFVPFLHYDSRLS